MFTGEHKVFVKSTSICICINFCRQAVIRILCPDLEGVCEIFFMNYAHDW